MLIRSLTRGQHYCGAIHTWVPDPDAYADMLHHGTRHPTVQAALNTPWRPGHLPCPVDIPIDELLGTDGHLHCHGVILNEPDLRATQHRRDEWLARRELGLPVNGLRKPRARQVPSFEDGTVVCRFGAAHHGEAFELINMYPMPSLPDPESQLGTGGTLIRPYWRTSLEVPFAALLRAVDAHCHPESNRGGIEVLLHRFTLPHLDEHSTLLLSELDAVLNGQASGMHPCGLYAAAEYGEGTDRAFARALLDLLTTVDSGRCAP